MWLKPGAGRLFVEVLGEANHMAVWIDHVDFATATDGIRRTARDVRATVSDVGDHGLDVVDIDIDRPMT